MSSLPGVHPARIVPSGGEVEGPPAEQKQGLNRLNWRVLKRVEIGR